MFGQLENIKKIKFFNDECQKNLTPNPKNPMTISKCWLTFPFFDHITEREMLTLKLNKLDEIG